MGKNFGPDGFFGIWGMRNDPEAFIRMMDKGEDFPFGGCNGPRAAKKVEGIVSVESALEVKGQMEVEQRCWRSGE